MKTIVSTSLFSFLILSIVLGVFGFCFSHWMMSVLQTPGDILDDAVLYLRVYFVGFPFLFMYNIPVSYTHLDVYKRQLMQQEELILPINREIS